MQNYHRAFFYDILICGVKKLPFSISHISVIHELFEYLHRDAKGRNQNQKTPNNVYPFELKNKPNFSLAFPFILNCLNIPFTIQCVSPTLILPPAHKIE